MSRTKPIITPEILTPRLGEQLVLEKHITQQQLDEALQLQKQFRLENPGKHAPLTGEILVELGYVEKEVVDTYVTTLIVRLKTALERSNALLEERVKERTQELEFALDKIKVLNIHKSEFISNISHELRTPLLHIIGYTYLFLDGTFGDLDDDQLEAMQSIKSATDRLETLITDLISFTEIDQGELLLHRNWLLPESLCHEAVMSNQETANKKNIQIHEQYPPKLTKIYADGDRIQWALRQLIANAIKFTPAGGHVFIVLSQQENGILFTVSDTGIGIPQDRIKDIFEPFLQLDGSSTRNAGGTGIGLTICKEIIEAHDSIIQVQSKVNQGSKFSFLIKSTEAAI